jgi:hypothetical protein
MERCLKNEAAITICLIAFVFIQLAGSAGAVICVKSDGQASLEWGCERVDDHPFHSEHSDDGHHLEEVPSDFCGSCNDIFVSTYALINTPNSRKHLSSNISIPHKILFTDKDPRNMDQHEQVCPPLISPQKISESVSFTVLNV